MSWARTESSGRVSGASAPGGQAVKKENIKVVLCSCISDLEKVKSILGPDLMLKQETDLLTRVCLLSFLSLSLVRVTRSAVFKGAVGLSQNKGIPPNKEGLQWVSLSILDNNHNINHNYFWDPSPHSSLLSFVPLQGALPTKAAPT